MTRNKNKTRRREKQVLNRAADDFVKSGEKIGSTTRDELSVEKQEELKREYPEIHQIASEATGGLLECPSL